MTRKTAERLHEAGFPEHACSMEMSPKDNVWPKGGFLEFHTGASEEDKARIITYPNAEDLIEVLGENIQAMARTDFGWRVGRPVDDPIVNNMIPIGEGVTLDEALAAYWLITYGHISNAS